MQKLTIILTSFLFLINILSASTLEMENKYIKIISDSDSGRFIIKTTGGDPKLDSDNNALLLFEKYPPTSFATIQIDKINFIFGDTQGKFEQAPVKRSGAIVCIWSIYSFQITQKLRFIKGPTTGNLDTVEISYRIWNKDIKAHNIGARIVFDTYLGKEDGAPFRIPGLGAVTTEKALQSAKIPEYWYSYDDLVKPTVRAQGTLKIKNFPRPDKIIFAGWHHFNDNSWDFRLKEGRSFKKSFLSPKDSAVGIFWEPIKIKPNDNITFKTYYGLYGTTISISRLFNLSLGGAVSTSGEPFLVNADMQNISSQHVKDVKAEIILPKGLKLQSKKKSIKIIGSMKSKEIKRASWKVVPVQSIFGKIIYKVKVTGIAKGKRSGVIAKRKINVIKKEIAIKKKEAEKEKIISKFREQAADIKVKKVDEGVSVELGDIFFKFNSDLLTKEARENLKKIGKVLKKYGRFNLIVKGFTDNTGKKKYNLELSKNRAKTVWKFLIHNNFINPEQATYKGFGEKNSIADNKTKKGRKKNRRVELIIIPELSDE